VRQPEHGHEHAEHDDLQSRGGQLHAHPQHGEGDHRQAGEHQRLKGRPTSGSRRVTDRPDTDRIGRDRHSDTPVCRVGVVGVGAADAAAGLNTVGAATWAMNGLHGRLEMMRA